MLHLVEDLLGVTERRVHRPHCLDPAVVHRERDDPPLGASDERTIHPELFDVLRPIFEEVLRPDGHRGRLHLDRSVREDVNATDQTFAPDSYLERSGPGEKAPKSAMPGASYVHALLAVDRHGYRRRREPPEGPAEGNEVRHRDRAEPTGAAQPFLDLLAQLRVFVRPDRRAPFHLRSTWSRSAHARRMAPGYRSSQSRTEGGARDGI